MGSFKWVTTVNDPHYIRGLITHKRGYKYNVSLFVTLLVVAHEPP